MRAKGQGPSERSAASTIATRSSGVSGEHLSIGGLGLIVATIAAGIALYRHAGAPVSVPILLGISGFLITQHPPPYGPGMAAVPITFVRDRSAARAPLPLGEPGVA